MLTYPAWLAILAISLLPAISRAGKLPNPISDFDAADPCILRANGKTYLYSTRYNSSGAYSIWASKEEDPSTWTLLGYVFTSANFPPWADRGRRYWAPEVHRVAGQYICYFCSHDKNQRFCIGAATSDNPSGPFKPQSKPLVSNPRYGLI